MADIDVSIAGIYTKRMRDMGDGSYAEVVSVGSTFVAGHERITNDGTSKTLTVPASAKIALITAEGGDVRYAPTGEASATSPGYIPAGSAVRIPPPAAVYGATGSYANIIYLA